MKKLLSLSAACLIILSLAGCKKEENKLFSVLYNEEPFVTIRENSVYLKEYTAIYYSTNGVNLIQPTNIFVPYEYTEFDLDNDGENELILKEEEYTAESTYLILRNSGDKVYGYSLKSSYFQNFKTDGSFLTFEDEGGQKINKIKFKDNKLSLQAIATNHFVVDNEKSNYLDDILVPDEEESLFEIDGKKVSFEEINKFVDDWKNQKEVKWQKIKAEE